MWWGLHVSAASLSVHIYFCSYQIFIQLIYVTYIIWFYHINGWELIITYLALPTFYCVCNSANGKLLGFLSVAPDCSATAPMRQWGKHVQAIRG